MHGYVRQSLSIQLLSRLKGYPLAFLLFDRQSIMWFIDVLQIMGIRIADDMAVFQIGCCFSVHDTWTYL